MSANAPAAPHRAGRLVVLRSRTRSALVGVMCLGLGTGACSTVSGGEGRRGPDAVTLEVDNRHWRDVVVYATRGGARNRLGLVTSNSDRSFPLARDFLAGGYTVTLLVEVVGSNESLRSGSLTVSPGDVILWRLQPALPQSNVSVRSGGGPDRSASRASVAPFARQDVSPALR